MSYLTRRMLFAAKVLRLVCAAAAFAAMGYGIYLAIYGSIVMGAVWTIASVCFGFAAHMLIGLVALLLSGTAAPAIRR